MKSFIVLLLAAVLAVYVNAQHVLPETDCPIIVVEGLIYNVSLLAQSPIVFTHNKENGDVYSYLVSVCRGLNESCADSNDPAASQCAVPGTAAVCESRRPHTPTSSTHCGGQAAGAKYGHNPALLPGLEITYPQGDLYNNVTGQYRYTKLVIVCSTIEEDAHWRLVKIAEAAEAVWIEITSPAGCPTNVDLTLVGGISPGSVLLIIFFVLLVAYLLIGTLYMRFARGAQGAEMIPNVEFWGNLPGLVKDGVAFAWRKITCSPAPSYAHV